MLRAQQSIYSQTNLQCQQYLNLVFCSKLWALTKGDSHTYLQSWERGGQVLSSDVAQAALLRVSGRTTKAKWPH